jgi:hypothetical protein
MAIGVEEAPPAQGPFVRPVTLGWFLKRMLVGVAILLIAMGGLAWLTYASIDPDGDSDAAQSARTVHETPAARLAPVNL